MTRLARLVLFLSAMSTASGDLFAQAGAWVLDGFPKDHNSYFSGRTEIVADGERLKISEWPENDNSPDASLVTYFLGQSVVKVFPWNGERVGLVFESDERLPRAEVNAEGQLVLPPPYPSRVHQESEVPCGEGCTYLVRNVQFEALDPADFAPGGAKEKMFVPPVDLPLLTREEFVGRYHIAPPSLGEWATGQRP
ncbi:MAG: hypothetical protein ACPG66_02000 [Flavobacteriales bacterium]